MDLRSYTKQELALLYFPSDEMDSKMHPALRAAAEEWIQQELQGVQSSASILYFLPFGRTLIFISDNR